ncbi:MAG: hypothetical protein ABJ059_05880, partial [Hyphomicrobiales bacterium]
MVSTKLALEGNGSQENLVVSRSKLGKVFRSEGPRHTPVLQGIQILGPQHSDFRLSGALVLSYNSGINGLRHARMRRICRSIS